MNRTERLNKIFAEVEAVILKRQHPVTGLLPASTSINSHGNYTDAWVRDNVYSILSVWALCLAYRRLGETERSDQLEQATVKLMRSLLLSMMRQAHKVEAFKHSLNPLDALHAKYDTATGLPVVADDAWGHLQIDATSLYLLMIAQMSGSGIRIIRTFGEVDFIQNLIYYIGSAYRTHDFGIWERGNKINNGKTEINASSVGMAKAALQALDGFNLFGIGATKRAEVHTVADSISLARNTLASLLPRESLSKEVDSALLSVIGFPAFAVGDPELVKKTRDEILNKLGGDYGCKRFLWDGHQTVLEESSRIHYEHSELVNFEHIESEWPLFFAYLYVQALFEENREEAEQYRKKLESLMVEVDGYGLLPELYYLEKENVGAEKENPRTQERVPNENIPLVWAQSLYITGVLLDEGFIEPKDLDPVCLRRRSRRHTKTQIALVVLAENDVIKESLAQRGIIAESLSDINPIHVVSAPTIVKTYAHVGENEALGLTGRPTRRLQSLATSQTYHVQNKKCLCLSWLQSEQHNYRSFDAHLVTIYFEREIKHIKNHWLNNEVAVFTWMVDQQFCETPEVDSFFDALRDLQLRKNVEYIGYASAALAYRASRVNHLNGTNLAISTYKTRVRFDEEHVAQVDKARLFQEAQDLCCSLSEIGDTAAYRSLLSFIEAHPLDSNIGEDGYECTTRQFIELIYFKAKILNYWTLARYCFVSLEQVNHDLSDALSLLVARHLTVTIGHIRERRVVFRHPAGIDYIHEQVIHATDHPLERALTEEILCLVGYLMRTSPDLFTGIRSIQISSLMLLCQNEIKSVDDRALFEKVACLAPSTLLERIEAIFISQRRSFSSGITSDFSAGEKSASSCSQDTYLAVDTDWFQWRLERGLITHLGDEFLEDIWRSLEQAKTLIFGDKGSREFELDCELARRSMTPGEANFARLLDKCTHHLHPPYYKSAVLEVLYAFTKLCSEDKDRRFEEPIVLYQVLENAAHAFSHQEGKQASTERDLDLLLEQPPSTLQMFAKEALRALK